MTRTLADLAPLDRLHALSEARQHGQLMRFAPTTIPVRLGRRTIDPTLANLILALAAFDDAATTQLERASLYLLGDESLLTLVPGPTRDGPVLLEALAVAGLLYRFPSAAKFGYNPSIVQLRINAWGLRVAERIRSAAVRDDAYRLATRAFSDNRQTYHQLLHACDAPLPLPQRTIHVCNKRLPLPVVT